MEATSYEERSMSKVIIYCVDCDKIKMDFVSSSGSTYKDNVSEIWECPKCFKEVMVIYEEK